MRTSPSWNSAVNKDSIPDGPEQVGITKGWGKLLITLLPGPSLTSNLLQAFYTKLWPHRQACQSGGQQWASFLLLNPAAASGDMSDLVLLIASELFSSSASSKGNWLSKMHEGAHKPQPWRTSPEIFRLWMEMGCPTCLVRKSIQQAFPEWEGSDVWVHPKAV